MTDKPKEGKVIGIRKDVIIKDDDTTLKPIQEVVDALKLLYEDAQKGLIREIAFSVCDTSNVCRFKVVGDMGFNWTLMYTQLELLRAMYFDTVVYVSAGGEEEVIDEDE